MNNKILDAKQAFLTKIQSLYYIEKQLEKALPKMAKGAKDPDLKKGFMMHLTETREHSRRLENIFKMLEVAPKKLTCGGIQGIIEDAGWVLKLKAPAALKDSMISAAARYAEHYEMAGYLAAIVEADSLDMREASGLLKDTLAEEESCDQSLEMAMKKNLGVASAA